MHQLAGFKEKHPFQDKMAHVGARVVFAGVVFAALYAGEMLLVFGHDHEVYLLWMESGEVMLRFLLSRVFLICPMMVGFVSFVFPNLYRDLIDDVLG